MLTKPIAKGALDAAAPINTEGRLAQLVLVRHGKPALSRKMRIDWRAYHSWWAAYGESGLAETETPPADLVELAKRADLIIASPLPRAWQTALALCNGREIIADERFVEAPLPSPPIPFLRLKPTAWGVLSRALWWLGYSGTGESRKHAKVRAASAAGRLIELARGRELVLLCAHGWFNRMIRKVLREQGWQCIYDGGDSYWAYRHFEPPHTQGKGPSA
ncbi:MAG: histidine phosphatase family protein [Alphaproteobacteria bacterium]